MVDLHDLVVPAPALSLVLNLEARGFAFSVEEDRLRLTGGDDLSETDRAGIRQWKTHLLAVLAYAPPIDPLPVPPKRKRTRSNP